MQSVCLWYVADSRAEVRFFDSTISFRILFLDDEKKRESVHTKLQLVLIR